MAIRDDFTAGEVLAAADLNDTFASKPPFAYGTATPSTTVEGFIWYDENSTPPISKFWNGSAFIPSGKILQVVSTTKTDTFTSTATSPTAITGLSATITPSFASSKIFVILTIGRVDSSEKNGVAFLLKRGSTVVGGGTVSGSRLSAIVTVGISESNIGVSASASYLDSPATTSATTYSIEGWNDNALRTFYVNRGHVDNDNTQASSSRNASTITLIEVTA